MKRKILWGLNEVHRVRLGNVVGKYTNFGPTLWGSFTLWGRHCGEGKKEPHNVGYCHQNSPQRRNQVRKTIFPTVLIEKFGGKISHCEEFISLNNHQTSHWNWDNLHSGELCKLCFSKVKCLLLFWIVNPELNLHYGEEIETHETSSQWKIYMKGNLTLWGMISTVSSCTVRMIWNPKQIPIMKDFSHQ